MFQILTSFVLLFVYGAFACNPPSKNSFTNIDQRLFLYKPGDVVNYECFPGFDVIEGSSQRTCLASLEWSGTPLTCKRSPGFIENVDCSLPPKVANGTVRFFPVGKTVFRQGDTVRYRCNSGYRLIGVSRSFCNRNEWSVPPTCEKQVACRHRNPPQNARYIQSQQGITRWYSGDIARFRCDTGYVMTGRAQSSCLKSGRWSIAVPNCRQRERDTRGCDRPNDPENGRIRSTPKRQIHFTDGQFVRYECNSGYTLSGNARADCVGGSWNNEPICQANPRTQCPHRTPRGMLRYVARQAQTRKWFVDDIAIFRCPPGYSMLGNRRSRCQHNGRWGTPLPSCLPVANEETNCMRPEDPVNGEVVSSPPDKFQFFEGDSIEYICKEGFENDGEQIATCESGAWTSEPACRRLAECNHRQPPENGAYAENQLEQTTWFERETAVFACKTGYRIAGSQTSACQSDGRWSTEVPECRKRETCPNRSPPVNGEYVRRQEDKTTWYSGELASFVCNPGFMLEGSSAICTSAGTWTNPVPVCRNEVFCPNRPAPSNGRTGGMRRNRWRARDIARYRCSKGYRLVGQARSTCLLTGEWSSEIPICEALRQLTCPRPSNPPNGRVRSSPVRKDIFRHNEFVNYQCYANFEVIGGPTVTCMDGKWSHVPLCKRLGQRDLPTCVRPNNPVNGRVRTRPAGKRIFDDREFVTYVCSSGYRVVGDPRATCTNGRWSHEPTCTPTSNRVRTTKRPRVTTTTASKRRSSAETERPVNCFPRPAPVNGAYVKRQQDKKVWRENDIASFECNPGYVLNGARRSSCSSFGVWSASVPICTKENVENELTCERPLNPRNGRILSIPSAQTVFDEEDVVIYICDEGFEIDTIPFATCRSGQWDRSPTCEGVASTRCINRPPPPNVQYITSQELRTTWNVGDLAAFQCEFDEFQMFGSSVSTCLSSGEWSSDVPTCERPPRDAADECSRPVNPLNGKVHSYPTSVYFFDIGDVVQVECDSGYELISDNDGVMTCLGNTWTAAPTCEEP